MEIFSNCKTKSYSDKIRHEVWRQIESFAGYSFSKAHSESYAVESFQSLFLKAHYPLEFMVAVINNFSRQVGGISFLWKKQSSVVMGVAPVAQPTDANGRKPSHVSTH